MTKHDFLAELHATLQPRLYLEIGVQSGVSLRLASCPTIGVDPFPLVPPRPNDRIFSMKSRDFFSGPARDIDWDTLDLVFIDGMHLVEEVAWDFANVALMCHSDTVVVIDDVLPYNQDIAARVQPPGDWTGDVWKLTGILDEHCSEVAYQLVDVWPTGIIVARGLDDMPAETFIDNFDTIVGPNVRADTGVPGDVLLKSRAVSPQEGMEFIRTWQTGQ